MASDKRDWKIIGSNVRFYREVLGYTQSTLARKAQVARRSVYALEQGNPCRAGTFRKICDALGMEVAEMSNSSHLPRVVDLSEPFFVHRRQDDHWYSTDPLDESRLDYQSIIQEADERQRLSKVGLASGFSHVLSLVMPRGPGIIFHEIHREQALSIPHVYENWMLLCLNGSVIFEMGGKSVQLSQGEVVASLQWDAPRVRIPSDFSKDGPAPQILLIGANRPKRTAKEDGE